MSCWRSQFLGLPWWSRTNPFLTAATEQIDAWPISRCTSVWVPRGVSDLSKIALSDLSAHTNVYVHMHQRSSKCIYHWHLNFFWPPKYCCGTHVQRLHLVKHWSCSGFLLSCGCRFHDRVKYHQLKLWGVYNLSNTWVSPTDKLCLPRVFECLVLHNFNKKWCLYGGFGPLCKKMCLSRLSCWCNRTIWHWWPNDFGVWAAAPTGKLHCKKLPPAFHSHLGKVALWENKLSSLRNGWSEPTALAWGSETKTWTYLWTDIYAEILRHT